MWFLTISTLRSSANRPSTLPSTPMATSIISASTVVFALGRLDLGLDALVGLLDLVVLEPV